jgi:two-component system, sensor histidine kinase and response regulator
MVILLNFFKNEPNIYKGEWKIRKERTRRSCVRITCVYKITDMKYLKNLSVTRKLTLIMVAVSVFALGTVSLAYVGYQSVSMKISARAELSTLARVIGINCTAALAFQDKNAARETIGGLKTVGNVIKCCIFTADGRPFACYDRDYAENGYGGAPAEYPHKNLMAVKDNYFDGYFEGIPFLDRHIDAFESIRLKDDDIGTVWIQSDFSVLKKNIVSYFLIALFSTLAACLLSILVAGKLQKIVSRPIRILADAMQSVSVNKDYGLRVEKESADELGVLFDGFNAMLGQIQSRDSELENYRKGLEEKVEIRTVELSIANQDLKDTIEELSHARDAAEAASRAKSQFLANMSHEIRTPLNGILGMTELILGTPLNERQQYLADTVLHSGDALLAIINDILDFSKIEAGKLSLVHKPVDLRMLLEEAVEMFAGRAHAKCLELACFISPEIPTSVWGDPDRIRQIIVNLVGNAVKFTRKGEVVCKLTGKVLPENRMVLNLSVRDSGIGIPEDSLKSIFEPFSQADESMTRKYGGTGLGLAISRQLAEIMGGDLTAESRVGLGSTFCFSVCLEIKILSKKPKYRADGNLGGVKVLLVDDNVTSLEFMSYYLSLWGTDLTTVNTGEEARAAVNAAATGNDPFDIALIDLLMPGMDGHELAQKIRKNPTLDQMHLVALSSMEAEDLSEETEILFSYVLNKPTRASFLYDCLAVLMGKADPGMSFREGHETEKLDNLENPANVLLVEDNLVNREYARSALEMLGCRVECRNDGNEGVNAFLPNRYDLILMDCQMPVMDGYEATRRIREIEQRKGGFKVPIIALTAHAMRGDREKCIEAGMDDYLSKPFKVKQLKATLEKWISPAGLNTPSGVLEKTGVLLPGQDDFLPTKQVLDMAAIENLKLIDQPGMESTLTRVISIFLKNTPALIKSFNDAMIEKDFKKINRTAHSLKGNGAMLGAVRFSKHCEVLEVSAGETTIKPGILKDLICDIEAEYVRVETSLRKVIAPDEAA